MHKFVDIVLHSLDAAHFPPHDMRNHKSEKCVFTVSGGRHKMQIDFDCVARLFSYSIQPLYDLSCVSHWPPLLTFCQLSLRCCGMPFSPHPVSEKVKRDWNFLALVKNGFSRACSFDLSTKNVFPSPCRGLWGSLKSADIRNRKGKQKKGGLEGFVTWMGSWYTTSTLHSPRWI